MSSTNESSQKYASVPSVDVESSAVPTAPHQQQTSVYVHGQPAHVLDQQAQLHVNAFTTQPAGPGTSVPAAHYDAYGNLIPYGELCSPLENGGILPSELGKWRVNLFDQFCACDSSCWMSWCCGCFVAGQIAEKLKVFRTPICSLTYQRIVWGFIILVIIGMLTGRPSHVEQFPNGEYVEVQGSDGINLQGLFILVCVIILRTAMRKRLSIPGTGCNDCCVSAFCMPCVLTQMQSQLWKQPEVTPGCSCGNAEAFAQTV